ncbi:MAG: hypothetical protein Tsb0021_08420 [Chlamydiales bacterium]
MVSADYLYLRWERILHSYLPDPEKRQVAQRIAVAALPYLSLYAPVGRAMTIGYGALNLHHRLCDIKQSWKQGDRIHLCRTSLKVVAAAFVLWSSVLNRPITIVITSAGDIYQDLKDLSSALQQKDLEKALDTLIHLINGSFYLAAILYGSLELLLASLIIQACKELYQSAKECRRDHRIETAAHLGMALVRLFQTRPLALTIKRKWDLFEKYALFKEQIDQTKKGVPSKNHPLGNPSEYAQDHQIVIENPDYGLMNLGAYISKIGGSIVKGMNICLRNRVTDGVKTTELIFSVNQVFREVMEPFINQLGELNIQEFKEFLTFAGIQGVDDIQLIDAPYEYVRAVGNSYTHERALQVGETRQIVIPHIGKIIIGTGDFVSIQERVVIQLEEGSQLDGARLFLALTGIPGALEPSTQDEIDRMSLGYLFRTFFPSEATSLSSTKEFFTSTVEELKRKMIELAPGMKKHIDEDLPDMKFTEVLPGFLRMGLSTIGKKAEEIGAVTLMTGVGLGRTFEVACLHFASILETGGLMPTQMRFDAGLVGQKGASSLEDLESGGADNVFTRIITDNVTPLSISDIPLSGRFVLRISLDALKLASYAYENDNFGDRNKDPDSPYLSRKNLFKFIGDLKNNFHVLNEVMIKGFLPTEYIECCIVSSEENKSYMIKILEERNLIDINAAGERTILGKLLDDFIRVDTVLDQA